MKINYNLKTSLYIALIFTFIGGIFMYLMKHQFGITYGDPEMPKILFFFEFGILVALLYLIKKNNLWHRLKLVSLKNIDWRYAIPILIIPIILLLILIYGFFIKPQVLFDNSLMIIVILITMICVGFNEEVIFRGFVFNSAQQNLKLWQAILIGAVAFMLSHSTNILGGMSITSNILQLINTFIGGLFFIFVFLKTKNIWIPIFFHFVWDFFLFSAPYFFPPSLITDIILITLNFEWLAIIVLFMCLFENFVKSLVFKISLFLCVLSYLSVILEKIFYGGMNQQGILQESFFLPLSYLLVFLVVILSLSYAFWHCVIRKK